MVLLTIYQKYIMTAGNGGEGLFTFLKLLQIYLYQLGRFTDLHTVCFTFTSSLCATCFSFQKPFSSLYYTASNLLGRFVFVSKNIFLVIIIVTPVMALWF